MKDKQSNHCVWFLKCFTAKNRTYIFMLDHHQIQKNTQPFSPAKDSHKSRIRDTIHQKPLIIFIRWHSYDIVLHNTFMFCSIICIFISTNLGLHWRLVQKCRQNIWSNYWVPSYNRNTHHKLWRKIYVLHIIKDTLVLNLPIVNCFLLCPRC
jgi:hypothetical protein